MERNARIVTLSVRYLDRKDKGRFARGVAWNYMWELKKSDLSV